MGWWATDVFGGDQPYNLLSAAAEVLGFKENVLTTPDGWNGDVRRLVRDGFDLVGGLDGLADALGVDGDAVMGDEVRHDDQIAVQVVVSLALGAGAPLDESWRARALHASQCDLWAHKNAGRCADMKSFYDMVAAYSAQPVALEHSGLFETIAESFGR